jgi:ribokinase
MTDIVVIGSLNMDLVVRVPQLPKLGETIAGSGFQMICGGKGANQAVAAARLGTQVAMVGRVGADAFGESLRANLVDSGVNTDYVLIDEGSASGAAMILVRDRDGDNSIVIAPGANGRVSFEDVAGAKRLFEDAKALIMQFEVPLEVVEQSADLARQFGVKVVLNPAPAYSVPINFLRKADYIILNETEAEILSGRSVGDLATARSAGQALVDEGLPVIILTLGENGALLVTQEDVLHVPARKVGVVDTTAAGDAFVAAFTKAIINGYALMEAVRYAVCAGTIAVTRFGAQTSLPSAEEVWAVYQEETSGQ